MSDTDGEVENMELEVKIFELKREKHVRKTAVTKTNQRFKRLCTEKSNIKTDQINFEFSQLWDLLGESLLIMDNLTTFFMKIKDKDGKLMSIKEADNLKKKFIS